MKSIEPTSNKKKREGSEKKKKRFDLVMDDYIWERLETVKKFTHSKTDTEVMQKSLALAAKLAPILADPNCQLIIVNEEKKTRTELDIFLG